MATKKRSSAIVICLIAGLTVFLLSGFTAAGESPLTVKKSSKNTACVELNNDVPVRGVQFTITGAKVTEVRNTARTSGFLTKFNDKNGTVLLVSASAGSIDPGKGPIVDIVCDKPGAVSLSKVKIVGARKK